MAKKVFCEICGIYVSDPQYHVITSEHNQKFLELLAQEETPPNTACTGLAGTEAKNGEGSKPANQ